MLCCLIPTEDYLHFEKGLRILAGNNDYDKLPPNTVEAYWEVLQLNKKKPDEAIKRYKASIEQFDKAVKSYSEFDDAWYAKGVAHYFLKEFEEAIHCFDKVLEILSKVNDLMYYNSRFWLYMGTSFNFLGKFDDAIKSFENAIKCSYNLNWEEGNGGFANGKGFDEVFLGMGYALYKTGNLDEARQYFEISLSDIVEKADTFAESTYKQIIPELEKSLGFTLSQSIKTQDNAIKREFEDTYDKIRNNPPEYRKDDEMFSLRDKKLWHECIKRCNEVLNYDLRNSYALACKIDSLLEIGEPKKALYFLGLRRYSQDTRRSWFHPRIERCLDMLGLHGSYYFPYSSVMRTNPYYKFR